MIREKSVLPTANNPYNEIGKDPCVFSDFILTTLSASPQPSNYNLRSPHRKKSLLPKTGQREAAVCRTNRDPKTDAPVKPRPLHIPPEATDTDEHTEPKQRHPVRTAPTQTQLSSIGKSGRAPTKGNNREATRPSEKDSGANRNLRLNHNCIHTPIVWTFRVSGEGCAWYRGNVGSSASES